MSAVYDNAGEPATSMVSPNMIGGKPTGDISLNLDKAKELLNKVGDIPKEMKIMTDSTPANIQTAQIIQANLKELGIDLIIEPVEWGTYLEKSAIGQHELILGGWFPELMTLILSYIHFITQMQEEQLETEVFTTILNMIN